MKKIIIGIVVGILPLYSFISWINIFYNEKLINQEARIKEYRKTFFGLIDDVNIITLLNILFCIVSIYILGSSFSKMKKGIKIFSSLLMIVLSILILYNIWSLL
ncbi:hypothetical protein [uncultured Polaribacter sp.]|uniref:hypothetical protein n=1 Tax=uncultured Polaribacter sp. TaxID=174711 RepID=UPI0026385F16|nr:hypothetical protein [uncultured Polaribacter sp.]